MKNKIFFWVGFLSILSLLYNFITMPYPNNTEDEDYVPNKETAIKVAEAIWLPIYGEKIYTKQPFVAELNEKIWLVKGSIPKNSLGGVPIIKIRKSDCKIICVTHTK